MENSFRGKISSVMGDKYIETDFNKKILYRRYKSIRMCYESTSPNPTHNYEKLSFPNEYHQVLEYLVIIPDHHDLGFPTNSTWNVQLKSNKSIRVHRRA